MVTELCHCLMSCVACDQLLQGEVTPTVPELNEANSCDRNVTDDETLDFDSTSQGKVVTLVH